jgi:hypothetical protein
MWLYFGPEKNLNPETKYNCLQSGTKKRHPLKMDILFSLGLNHSAYVTNEQNPLYNDL